MTVKCIKKPGKEFVERNVTVGKTYWAICEDEQDYKLINNKKLSRWYRKEYFETVEPPKEGSK